MFVVLVHHLVVSWAGDMSRDLIDHVDVELTAHLVHLLLPTSVVQRQISAETVLLLLSLTNNNNRQYNLQQLILHFIIIYHF